MGSIGIKFEGMDALAAKFNKLSQLSKERFFHDEYKSVVRRIKEQMRLETPVYKGKYWKSKQYPARNHPAGTLRESIGSKMGGMEIPTAWVSLNRRRGIDAFYSHMVIGGHEYGSVRVKPNPIVRRTWEMLKPWIEITLRSKFENKIKIFMQK